jgi:hypothetical protein
MVVRSFQRYIDFELSRDITPSYTLVVFLMIDGGQDDRIKGFIQEEAPNSYCIGLPRVKRLLHRNLARSCGKQNC